MAKERIQTRVEDDTFRELTEYGSEAEVSQSEAVRRLVKVGLTAEGRPVGTATHRPPIARLGSKGVLAAGVGAFAAGLLLVVGATVAASSSVPLALAALGVGIPVTTVGALTAAAAAAARMAHSRTPRAGAETDGGQPT